MIKAMLILQTWYNCRHLSTRLILNYVRLLVLLCYHTEADYSTCYDLYTGNPEALSWRRVSLKPSKARNEIRGICAAI